MLPRFRTGGDWDEDPTMTLGELTSLVFRQPSRWEIASDAIVHALGIALGCAGAVTLLLVAVPRGDYAAYTAAALYSVGLIAMWVCSSFYNLWRSCPRRALLRCSDQAAIFAMIAGTYTPFTLMYFDGVKAIVMTLLIWAVAGLSIGLRLLQPIRFERVSIGLYLALGWVGVLALGPLFGAMDPLTLVLLAAGGLLYTAGIIFHLWDRLPFQSAIWHGFVLAAAGCHYAAVLGTMRAFATAL